MKFTEYQKNNMLSLITYLEDCKKYNQELDQDYWLLNNAIRALKDLQIES